MVVAAAVVMHYIYMLSIISPLDVAFIYLYILHDYSWPLHILPTYIELKKETVYIAEQNNTRTCLTIHMSRGM